MRLRIALALSTLAASASHGLAAEAITYKGTLGKIPVILEMAAPDQDSDFPARYAYLAKAVDIPLHGTVNDDGSLAIEEEAPCDEKLCRNAEGQLVEEPPIGADWTLAREKDGRRLTGAWKDRKSGKSLPVTLEQVGSRTLAGEATDVESLDPGSVMVSSFEVRITPTDLPYDFLKLAQPVKQGKETRFESAAIRMDSDPRTDTAYPAILTLGGADTAAINTYLKQRWLQFRLPAYSCKSQAYLGMNWSGTPSDGGNGYEDGGSAVRLEHLTPRLLGLVESGSYYCGGAYPDHFENRHFADVRTGQPLQAESLLKGFVLKNSSGEKVDPGSVTDTDYVKYGPDADLIKFVNDRRDKSDASVENDCGMNELVATNLGVYFTQTEMVFNLQGLPHVSFACGNDLVRVPLKDARPLLTDKGAKYFAIFDK